MQDALLTLALGLLRRHVAGEYPRGRSPRHRRRRHNRERPCRGRPPTAEQKIVLLLLITVVVAVLLRGAEGSQETGVGCPATPAASAGCQPPSARR